MNVPMEDEDTVSTPKRSVPEGEDEASLGRTRTPPIFTSKLEQGEWLSTTSVRPKMMRTDLRNPSKWTSRRYRETCNICLKNQEDPVCTPCGDVFCRKCILTHLEKQSATGYYTCPACSCRFLTRPGIQPHPHGQLCYVLPSSVLHKQMVERGEDDPFHSFSVTLKASLKNRIERFGEGIPKAASHTSHTICIVKDTTLDPSVDPWLGTFYNFSEVQQRFRISEFSCNDIFTAHQTSSERVIRTAITQGPAGIGKTTSVQKFILDWADGSANQHVNFVFLLPFWKLNHVKGKSCSLHELLLNFHPELNELADLKTFDNAQIVVIFDGVDESQLPLDFQNNQMVCDISETASVDTLVTNIIKGNLLPFAKVWMTSDASPVNQIPSRYINRVTELLPFSDSQMEECVEKSVNDVREARKIIEQIQKSRSLNAMCHIPALCSIAVSLVKNILEQSECRMIQTCTELYSHFLVSQMNAEYETKSSSVHTGTTRREMMLRLAELAFRHLMKNNSTFSEQDLKECGIDISDLASFFRICIEVNQERSEFFQEKVYRFTHVRIQEFLSALCVFYAYNSKNMDILHNLLEGKSRIQPEEVSLDILLRSAVDKVLVWKNRHQYILPFLLGMSLESNQILLQGLLKDTCSRSATTESTLKYIKCLGRLAHVSAERHINLLYCQIEMQDPCVIEDIGSLIKSQRDIQESCLTEISTLIKMSGSFLDEFNLKDIHHSVRHSALRMVVSSCRKAQLSDCNLFQDSCGAVASVLQQPHCALRELDMSRNYLGDSGVHLLCPGLKSPNCKLEILRLSACNLFRDSCGVVASVLQQPHCALRELDMSRNNLGDSGVRLLCPGLKSPNCKLEILRLSRCHLTMQSCLILNSFLDSDNFCLRELDVSNNYLEDSGVELLTEKLKDPNCKLKTLKINPNFLFDAESILPRPLSPCLSRTSVIRRKSDLKAPLPISSKKPIKSNFRLMRRTKTLSDHFKEVSLDSVGGDSKTCEAPGPSGAALPHTSVPVMTESFAVKVEDLCSAEARECNGDVRVFTPESTVSEKITYRFSCSSAGVHQCRYTGLIFKTDTAAEVQYQTVSWDYRKLEREDLVAVGPLFKMKGLQGAVSQLGFPHCEIFSSDKTLSLTVIHITDSRFEMLEPLKTSDSHVFLNITGFCKFGLGKKRCKEMDDRCQIKALVMLFLSVQRSTLNVLLLPRNVVCSEVCEKWRNIPEQSTDIYVVTTSECNLFLDEKYSLTCSSHEHRLNPKTNSFNGYGNYRDYYPAFQVFLSKIEPIELYLNERGNVCVWESYINLPAYLGETSAEYRFSSPYTPPGQDFFHKHQGALETRLGLLRPILSELEKCEVLNPSEIDEVESKASRSKQNRTLLLMLENKGGPAQEEFYKVLVKCDKFLVKGLETPHDYRTSA